MRRDHSMKWLRLAGVAGFVILSACTYAERQKELAAPNGDLVPFEHVASAVLSPVDSPTYRVILNQETWAAAWSELVAEHWPPAPPAPSVDFQSHIIVFVGPGALPTQLQSFGVEEVRLLNGVLHVTILEDWPSPRCGSLPVITRPVDIVSIPRLSTEAQFLTHRSSSC